MLIPQVSNGASLSSTSEQCNTPCAGAPSQTCGGPDALQVYTNANYKSASSGAYTNTGCVQEVDGRLLRGASIASDSMTIETCTSFCQSQGMSIAGLEYGREVSAPLLKHIPPSHSKSYRSLFFFPTFNRLLRLVAALISSVLLLQLLLLRALAERPVWHGLLRKRWPELWRS